MQTGPSTQSRGNLIQLLKSGYTWAFLAALCIRWVYLTQALGNNEIIEYPLVDARVYVDWAHEILSGKLLWHGARTYTPGMPAWIALWTGLLGDRAALHFAGFMLMGAFQAVMLGKIAEMFWRRGAGLVTAWLAALYWPMILFEGTYYAEPLAIFSLTVSLYLITRWARGYARSGALLGAGLFLGFAILVRSNTMLCAPVLALWVAVVAWQIAKAAGRSPWWPALRPAVILAIPSLSICTPVVLWNWKVTGVPEIRTGAWLSVYLGTNPEYKGLVVPVGVRWTDFVNLPIRAGKLERGEQNDYWREQVAKTIREQPAEYAALLGRKALMITNQFEVSQEIDIQVFRSLSSALSLPLWPGWGIIFPLALAAAANLFWSRDARRGWPLVLFGFVYMLSVFPVQVAGRYRLPTVVALLPLAGWMIAEAAAMFRRREFQPLLASAGVACAGAFLAWPDWAKVRDEKIINHHFLVGLRREDAKDPAGAAKAYEQGAIWNPADPDCPYRLGTIALRAGDKEKAAAYFSTALRNFSNCSEALVGLGRCAAGTGSPDKALELGKQAIRLAPGSREAYAMMLDAYNEKDDWRGVAEMSAELRTFAEFPASVAFNEARALALMKEPRALIDLMDQIAAQPWHSPTERARAEFLSALLTWRVTAGGPQSAGRWETLAKAQESFFQIMAKSFTGQLSADDMLSRLPPNLRDEPHLRYTLAAMAVQKRDIKSALEHLNTIVQKRNASQVPARERTLLEIWALEDLANAPTPPP